MVGFLKYSHIYACMYMACFVPLIFRVCHLAGELVGTLKMKQPELGITSDDMLCVKMAGLCLNLGCGPFSYMFETSFIPKTRKDLKNWKVAIYIVYISTM